MHHRRSCPTSLFGRALQRAGWGVKVGNQNTQKILCKVKKLCGIKIMIDFCSIETISQRTDVKCRT